MARTVPVITVRRAGRTTDIASAGLCGLTFGRRLTNSLVSPHAKEEAFPVLGRSLLGWKLRIPEGATASFVRGGSRVSLDDMVQWGLVKQAKGWAAVRLETGTEAEVAIGEDTLSVGFGPPVARRRFAPEPVAADRLPPELRRTPLPFEDKVTSYLFAALFIAAAISLTWLHQVPWPTGLPTLETMPYRISRLLLERTFVAPAPAPTAIEGKGAAPKGEAETPSPGEPAAPERPPEPAPSEKPPPSVTPPAAPSEAMPAGPSREAIREQVSKVGILGVLSGKGTAGRSVARSSVTALQLDQDLDQRLDEVLGAVGGITLTASGGSTTDAGGGTGAGGGLLGIDQSVSASGVGGPVQVSRLQGVPTGVPGGEGFGGEDAGPGSAGEDVPAEKREERSSRAIAKVVAAHTGAIRYAYNRELRKNPTLRGKVVMRFTIMPEGDVTECAVEQTDMNWPPLENSLVKIVLGWKFPPIPRGVVTVSYPLVFFPSM